MSSLAEIAASVTLLRSGRRAWGAYPDLIENAGSALAVLEEEQAASLFPELDLEPARTAITAWRQQGIRVITVIDDDYPENLRAVHDRPPLIFVAGQLCPQDARAVSVIGARRASSEGLEAARAVSVELTCNDFTVASGLAGGIDTAAHVSALERGGRTIAVIGTGIFHSYPPQNAALQRQISDEGAVISQFWPDAPPTKGNFPRRNAVMSGLSLATVVIEAGETSGARIQARLALGHGRTVFLRESLLKQTWARDLSGRPGTHVFRDPQALVARLQRITPPGVLTA